MRGFTAIEVLVSVTIIIIISIIIFLSLSEFRETQVLNQTVTEISSIMYEARFRTLSSLDSSQYGVHFEEGQVILFKGSSYSPPNPEYEDFILDDYVEISSISLFGSGQDIVFQRITGEVSEYGDITIMSKNDNSKTRTIKIEQSGLVVDEI
jgi:type II secretory pathway pseudopilin PulG